jgi:two-component system, cell cycle response regulator
MNQEFHDIALVGFSGFEFSTFETFLRLVSSRRPKPYRAVRTGDTARLVIVDGSSEALVHRLSGLLKPHQTGMVIGASDFGTGWTCISRPINLSMVLGLVDRMFVPQPVAAPAPAPASAPVAAIPTATSPAMPPVAKSPPQKPFVENVSAVPTVFSPAAPNPMSQAPASAPRHLQAVAPAAIQPPAAPVQNVPPAGLANILVVDDSDVALKFIQSRLSAFGFNVDLASSGEEALVRVSDGEYKFVFLDVMMPGLDGYQTCRAIKKRKFSDGRAPVVIMLTSRGGTVDKVRGTFAGCDAYLTKPLDESKMLRVLLKHDESLSGHIDTDTRAAPGPASINGDPMRPSAPPRSADAAQRALLAKLNRSDAIR